MKTIVASLISVVVGAFLGAVLGHQPQVTTSAAQQFFSNYYRKVTQANQRTALFREDLTTDFQTSPHGSWPSYNSFWQTEKTVVVNDLASVSGNPLSFNLTLTYYPTHGGNINGPQQTIFSLVCNGSWPSLLARIPGIGCPVNHLQIQSALNVTSSAP